MCKKIEEINHMTPSDLLARAGIGGTIPVDMKRLLLGVGISALPMDFSFLEESIGEEIGKKGPIIGAAVSNGDNLAIFYDRNATENRRRFTIAHELGHLCLYGDRFKTAHIEFRSDCESDDPDEVNANIFAGELLIPEADIKSLHKGMLIPIASVLADSFKVSISVMKARLKYLGLECVDL